MSKPSSIANWDTNATNRSAPTAGHQTDGYAINEIPTSTELNGELNILGQWVAYLNAGAMDGAFTFNNTVQITGRLTALERIYCTTGFYGAAGAVALFPAGLSTVGALEVDGLSTLPGGVLVNNANVSLTGTAYVKRAKWRVVRVPIIASLGSVASGSTSSTGGFPGAEQAISSVVYYPLTYSLAAEDRLQSVDIVAGGGASFGFTAELFVASINLGTGAQTFVSIGSSNAPTGGHRVTATCTPTSPATGGGAYWVKVTTNGSDAIGIVWADISYDTP